MLRHLLEMLNATRRRGGLVVDGHKHMSTGRPVMPIPLPAELVLPLCQHQGAAAVACVRPGDRVRAGALLAQADGALSAALHAPASGRVVAVEPRPVAGPPGTLQPCIVLEPDGAAECARTLPPLHDWSARPAGELRHRVAQAGVVGLGGAGFPTAVKLEPGPDSPVDILLLNGAECEPYISCDDMLMRTRPQAVVTGALVMARAAGASRIVMAVEEDKPAAIAALREALVHCATMPFSPELITLPPRYPGGDERVLVPLVTGRRTLPGARPTSVGVLCQNVATAAAVYDAVVGGQPLVDRLVTVTGEGIARPQVFRVPLGTVVSDLVAATGGYRPARGRLILGGSMMGQALDDDRIPVTKTTSCVLVPGSSGAPAPERPCIRCGDCARVCPVALRPQQLHWHVRGGELDRAGAAGLLDCTGCACCDVVCPSAIRLAQTFVAARDSLRERDAARRQAAQARLHFEARQRRLAQQQAEQAARLERKRQAVAGAGASGTTDPRRAAIEAALERVRARRQGSPPSDTPPGDS